MRWVLFTFSSVSSRSRHGVVVDHVLVDVPAGARRRGRELAVLVHDLGGPRILARREIEERPVEHLAETEDAELAVELVRPAALDERRGLGRRRRVRRVERQRLPESNRQRTLRRARGQERRLAQAVDAREPDRIELAHEVREVLLALRGRGRRHRVVQRIRRLERHEPRGVAARAVGRVQPDRFEREAVGVDDAVALLHEERILRRHAVELREREPARRVGELPRRPAALHHDPARRAARWRPWRRESRALRGASRRLRSAPARARCRRRA